MTMNTSGPISLGGPIAGQSVNLEIQQPANATVSFNDPAVATQYLNFTQMAVTPVKIPF